MPIKTQYQVKNPKKIRIAVVDTYIDETHPLIKDFVKVKIRTPKNQFHATGVVGVIASHLNRVFGEQAKDIFEIEVYSYNNKQLQSLADIAYFEALRDAIKSKPDLLNISVAKGSSDEIELRLINLAQDLGIKVIAAAGNGYDNGYMYPCAYTSVVCVGALNQNSSSRGSQVDLWTKSGTVISSAPDNDLKVMTGTSFSAPLVTAYFASLMVNPKSYNYFKPLLKLNNSRYKDISILTKFYSRTPAVAK